jgi:hypothetical protein
LGHWSGGLAACSGEMVTAHWVEVVAIEASASGSSNVGLESSASVLETESKALALASAPVHLEWLVELVRLREARPNITPRGLSREWHFPLAIILHFLYLIFNDNGLVDHVLEVGVVCVKQLELNVIIQPTQKHVLLLLIRVDVIRGIP